MDDINNAAKNQKKDKFDQKYSYVVCNEIFADKACLDNLPSTKDDFASIRGLTNMMGIDLRNRTELVDVGCDKMNEEYEKQSDKILAQC